tara:strand:+ start:80 stop:604 length:525 start_codon:yes stop_codon:yes gene_type:complete
MRKGLHTIRSGFTDLHNPTVPREYNLDNGDFEKNMKIRSVEIMFATTATSGGNQDRVAAGAVLFTVATSSAGAVPTSSTASPSEYDAQLSHRFSDSRQICWGILQGSGGLFQPQIIIDPDHIIPGDLYVNAWSISSGGSIEPIANPIGFVIKMEQVTSTGNEALLYQVKETDLE